MDTHLSRAKKVMLLRPTFVWGQIGTPEKWPCCSFLATRKWTLPQPAKRTDRFPGKNLCRRFVLAAYSYGSQVWSRRILRETERSFSLEPRLARNALKCCRSQTSSRSFILEDPNKNCSDSPETSRFLGPGLRLASAERALP